MFDETRINIYDYAYGLFYGKVTENVYMMDEPQELTDSDTEDGFIVIRVGSIEDASEFRCEAYGSVRVFVIAYVPTMSRGRLDKEKYIAFETAIKQAIDDEIEDGTSDTYSIEEESVLSMDGFIDTNANNVYHTFVKSFLVTIN